MANTYLSWTPSANPTGAAKKFTFSAWLKFNKVNPGMIMVAGSGTNSYCLFGAYSSGQITLLTYTGYVISFQTSRVFRDLNAWYHVVLACDTNQASATDGVKLYINGVQETFSLNPVGGESGYTQNTSLRFGTNGELITIGRNGHADQHYFHGVMSYVAFVDGQQLTPSTFGSTDATTGEWKIKTTITPGGTGWGTNGFFILKDGNSVTDQSGNSNNFTVAQGTLTKTEDNPSNVFATLNPLNIPVSNQPTFSNGNTTSISSSSGGDNGKWGGCSTLGMTSGKFYCEAKATVDGSYSRNVIGVTGDPTTMARANNQSLLSNTGNSSGYYSENGQVNYNNSAQYTAATYGTGDIIQIAIDLDNNRLFYGKNGTWLNSGDPTSSTGAITIGAASTCPEGAYFFAQNDDTGTSAQSKFEFNFGNGYFGTTAVASAGTNASNLGIFEYNVPAGYTALCTKGLNL